jgi:hypothetical protein|tara:strand:- start:1034 stop:1447 length:414 start_codon:yes stop_codon:yes gene_type:complete
MNANTTDFSEIGNAKYETRFIINTMTLTAWHALRVSINENKRAILASYLQANVDLDFAEKTIIGYMGNRQDGKEQFKLAREDFFNKKKALGIIQIKNGDPDYLNLLYDYNLKRYDIIRNLMSRYNIEDWKNKQRAKD